MTNILYYKKIIVPLIIFLGAITSFSLPPYNFTLINFITFPIFFLIIVIHKDSSKNFLFLIGWLFGFGYFISNLYWISYSLTHDEIFKFLIPFSIMFIPLFLAIFYGLSVLVLSFFNFGRNFQSILIFSLIFSIMEFLRGHVLSGFPWNLIVYSLSDKINHLQVLSLTGTYSLNLLCITIFFIPCLIFYKKKIIHKVFILLTLLVLIFANNFFGSYRINNLEKIPQKYSEMKIKIVSPRIEINRFFNNSSTEHTINEIVTLTNSDENKPSIYIFPEGIFPDTNLDDLIMFKKIIKKNFGKKDVLIIGLNTNNQISSQNKIYNSLVVVDNELNILHVYNKNKLVPFGEFLPFENFFRNFGLKKVSFGYESFSRGEKREPIYFDNLKIKFLPTICYEMIYSGKIKGNNKDLDFFINISEDGWFGNSIGIHQHFVHSIFRSIEEGTSIMRSANNGISAFISPFGKIINQIKSTKKGVIEIKSYYSNVETIFSREGNKIFFYFLLIYISLIFLIKTRKKK